MQPKQFDVHLDASGLICPLPVIRASEAMAGLRAGQILKVTATDPAAREDFRAWAERLGHEILNVEENGKSFEFYIRKGR